ncbi:hypothetical protein PIB30_071640 [Stylosanthes scabra]|uniref:RNase H type-1 domain-containing protein n=1 Tax=Stylosanthes scabra TaxID=79078 RepID=A0ABU6WM71_9FABA|nr:hypothetical protein [Stylosanthes scabra]
MSSSLELKKNYSFTSSMIHPSLLSDWSPPMGAQINMNCDASVTVATNSAGYCYVIKDTREDWITGCSGSIHIDSVVEVCLVQRTANVVADAMAKVAAIESYNHVEWLQPWADLNPLLMQDSSLSS